MRFFEGTWLDIALIGPIIAALLTLLVSLPLLLAARWFALSLSQPRAGSLRHSVPPLHSESWAPDRPSSDEHGSFISLGPLGVLNPGERVAASLRNRNHDYPDFLIATDQRIISVRADRHGALLQLAVQAPWQLARCHSETFQGRGTVTVEFHNGSHMLIECADPEESQLFGSALNHMARP